MDYNNYLNPTLVGVKPSGIRKFFSIAEEMDDVYLSVSVSRILKLRGTLGKQVLTRLNRVLQDIRLMPDLLF